MGRANIFHRDSADYDYVAAEAGGIKRDKTGHMGSRSPKSGQILKGKKHPTYYKTKKAEALRGSTMLEFGGRTYSVDGTEGRRKKK